jgi:hypothetical protein
MGSPPLKMHDAPLREPSRVLPWHVLGALPWQYGNVPAVPCTVWFPVHAGPLPHLHAPASQALPLTQELSVHLHTPSSHRGVVPKHAGLHAMDGPVASTAPDGFAMSRSK